MNTNSRQGVANRQDREVDVHFSGVNCLSSELRLHLFRSDT